jgi:putative transcriptional regulator
MNETGTSLTGRLLIAMPGLSDPNFWQSVVLLGTHSDEDGAFGLVINRALDVEMRDILDELGLETDESDLPEVLAGGPVQPSHGFVLFEDTSFEATDDDIVVSDSIIVSGSTETLARLTQEPTARRYFLLLGYAGWHPGQLEREIENNSWVVAPFDPTILFDVTVGDRWSAALQSIGIEPGTLVDSGSSEPS